MRRFFFFVTAHPLAVLAIALAVSIVFGAFALTLTRDPSPDSFIPKDLPALARKQQVEREFGLTEPMVVAVFREAPGGVFTPHTLRLIRDLTAAIRQLPQVKPDDVLSIATESGVFFRDGEPAFELLMKETPSTPAACEALKRDVLGYELYRGTLVSADGTAACIVIRPADSVDDDRLYRALSDLVAWTHVRDERLVVAGEAAVRAHMGAAVSDDALRMNFICPVVMALLIALAYRTPRGTILPLAVIGGASVLALGLMALCRVPVYIVTNGIFVIIMALGVSYSVHLIGQYYEEQLAPRGRGKPEIIVDACMTLWYPILATSVTDFVGFLSLHLTGVMPPIKYFGLFTCVGVLGSLFLSYTIVPAGLAILPLRQSKVFQGPAASGEPAAVLDGVGRLLGRLGAFTFRRRGLVLAVGAVVLGVAGWGASRLIVNDARILAFKDRHPIVQATNAINARFDGTSFLNIVLTASRPGDLLRPEVLQRIADLEAFTETLPYVGGTHSVAGWVKRAHQKLHQDNPAFYAIPQNEADARFYLDVLGAPTSPMSRLLREIIDPTYAKTELVVRMRSGQYIHQREVIGRLRQYLDEHFGDGTLTAEIAGRADLDYHWVKIVRDSQVNSVGFSFFSVLVLTVLMFRSLTGGLLCTFTAGIAVLVNYAVMGLFDIPLGVSTSMFASIALGVGVNFPILVLERLRLGLRAGQRAPVDVFRDSIAFTGRALFFTAVVVTVGFGLLGVSEFRTLILFGLLVALSTAVSFLAAVTILPAVTALAKPRFLWPPRPR